MSNEKSLVSLEEANTKQAQKYVTPLTRPNGIACPKCGKELVDYDLNVVKACDPPQIKIRCEAEGCGYQKWRIL